MTHTASTGGPNTPDRTPEVCPADPRASSPAIAESATPPQEPIPDLSVHDCARLLRSVLMGAIFDGAVDEPTLRAMVALLPPALVAEEIGHLRRIAEERAAPPAPPPEPSWIDLAVEAWQVRLDAGWRHDLDAALDAIPLPPWATVPFVDAVALVAEGGTVEWGRTAEEAFRKHVDHLRSMTATAHDLAGGWGINDEESAAEMLGRTVLRVPWALFRMRMPPGMLEFLARTDPVDLGPFESTTPAFCTLLRERLDLMESTPRDLAAELGRISSGVTVEQIERWLAGTATPDGWQVSAIADAFVLRVEERNTWIASARAGGVR